MIAPVCPNHGKWSRCEDCKRPDALPVVAAGPRRSRFRSTPTTRDGIRFASKGEAELYDEAKTTGAIVIPHVRFPLHVLTTPGQSATWFSPDLLVFPKTVMVSFRPETPSSPRYEAWEFKGPRATESRDYALRARAFRATYPTIPLRVWRKVKGRLVEDASITRAAAPGGSDEG